MDSEQTVLTFHAEGSQRLDGNVPAHAVLDMLTELISALESNADYATREMNQHVEWVVADARHGSLEVAISPLFSTPGARLAADQAMGYVVRQIEAEQSGRTLGIPGTRTSTTHIRRMLRIAREGGIPAVRVSFKGRSVSVTTSGVVRAPKLAVDRSLGSVEGTIMGLTFAGSKPQFTLRNRLDNELVDCFFDQELKETVTHALLKRVRVTGLVTTRSNGIVPSVTDIEDIYEFPDDRSLPTIDDIIGITPDLTEGLSSEDWVRSNREFE